MGFVIRGIKNAFRNIIRTFSIVLILAISIGLAGEQQRVAIARSLANHPKIILADEPTGNLDSQTGKVIIELLLNLAKTEKTTILTVTHDQSVEKFTPIIFRMSDGKLTKV